MRTYSVVLALTPNPRYVAINFEGAPIESTDRRFWMPRIGDTSLTLEADTHYGYALPVLSERFATSRVLQLVSSKAEVTRTGTGLEVHFVPIYLVGDGNRMPRIATCFSANHRLTFTR